MFSAESHLVNAPGAASRARKYLREAAAVIEAAAERCPVDVVRAADCLVEAYRRGGKVLLCGNGGSAADCQHMAAELVGTLRRETHRPPLAAIALTTDTSLLTSYANDFSFDLVFERQVRALGRPEDVLVAFSTSGESPNVLAAVAQARSQGMRVIAVTGDRGRLGDEVDVAIRVPGSDTQHMQEAHGAILHALCAHVEHAVFGGSLEAAAPVFSRERAPGANA